MPRRNRPPKREIPADIKYNSVLVQQFINKLMMRGKLSTAQRVFYDALELAEQRAKRSGLEVFEQAIRNATPILEVKPRRVGGATYHVPVEVRADRRISLAIRWLIQSARARARPWPRSWPTSCWTRPTTPGRPSRSARIRTGWRKRTGPLHITDGNTDT
jgi:small subunit ribosomal protein S7